MCATEERYYSYTAGYVAKFAVAMYIRTLPVRTSDQCLTEVQQMDDGQLMFKIDVCSQKLANAASTISMCVAQLSEQRDESIRQLQGRVKYAEIVQNAMAAYLTAVGQFRGKTVEEVVEYFRHQMSPSLSLAPGHEVEASTFEEKS